MRVHSGAKREYDGVRPFRPRRAGNMGRVEHRSCHPVLMRWLRLLLCTCVVSATVLSGCITSSTSPVSVSGTESLTQVVAPIASDGPQPLNLATLIPPSVKFARSEWAFDLSKTYFNPYYTYDASDTS